METLIQAGNNGLRVASVDIRVNPKTRDSRLFSSIPQYLWKTGSTMVAMFILYRPTRLFCSLAAIFMGPALFLAGRFLYLVYLDPTPELARTYFPSLVVMAILSLASFMLLVVAVLAELLRAQRRLTEENLYFAKRIALEKLADN